MKNKSLIPILVTGMFFVACSQEQFEPVIQENLTNDQNSSEGFELVEDEILGANFHTGSAMNITANWEAGSTTLLGGQAHAAQNNTVKVFNEASTGRVIFTNWNDYFIGRTNGAGNNGTATHAFGFKRNSHMGSIPWSAMVPFAFGITNGTNNGREALWTPWFENVAMSPVYMGLFATDNGIGDEDNTPGIIKVGDFRALDEDVRPSGAGDGRVVFQKWNGSIWQQIGRTNGPGDNGDLLAFTVVNVRTDYTVSGGKVTAQKAEAVPVAKIARPQNKTRLSTAIYANNIG